MLAAVDDERIRGRRDLTFVVAVVGVVLEEVGVHLRVGEIVHRDDLELRVPLEDRLQELPADASETVDADAHTHG